MRRLTLSQFTYEFPVKSEPAWSGLVERWYQLDAPAYGMTQAYAEFKSALTDRPDLIILASPGSSGETDFQFASTGASSPSKFVHTLPSVRGASLLKVMDWHGPLLCVQNDPETWLTGLHEALTLSQNNQKRIWVLTAEQLIENPGMHRVALADFAPAHLTKSLEKTTAPGSQTLWISQEEQRLGNSPSDSEFWNWLSEKKSDKAFWVSNQVRLLKADASAN